MLRLAHPELAWGLLLVAVPVAIHLINRFRQHRVEWAAMEFLLESQRKHKTAIRLRELLLLLLRMAAIAGLVFLVARPAWRPNWTALGGSRSHQIVLVDDSFSMTDRGAAESTFDRAKAAVARLGDALARDRRGANLSVARTSQRPREGRGWQTDLHRQRIDESAAEALADLSAGLAASESAVGPAEAIEDAMALVSGEDTETEIWFVTDVRRRQWSESRALDAALDKLAGRNVRLHVLDCAERPRGNLAVRQLAIRSGNRVAGVPVTAQVEVENFGEETAENIVVEAARGEAWQPAVTFERIEPGQKAQRSFPWIFSEAGTQVMAVRLPADAVADDNRRFDVVETVAEAAVLVIDDDPRSGAGRFLALALAPGGRVRTGLAPRVEPSSFLANHSLDEFSAIYLANLQRLDPAARDAVAGYLAGGGGVAAFVGPATDWQSVTADLYRGGEGWFPLPLAEVHDLPRTEAPGEVDLVPRDPELFRIFAGQRNTFLQSVRIDRFAAPPEGWKPEAATTKVLAETRSQRPLVVERRVGRGRAVAFLTTAAPLWNDWGRNPSFVVMLLELQARLAAGRFPVEDYRVGQALPVTLPPGAAARAVRFQPPEATQPPMEVATDVRADSVRAILPEAAWSGVYRVEWGAPGEPGGTRLLAVNVDPAEGDLARAETRELRERYRGRPVDFAAADGWRVDGELAGWRFTQWLVLGLFGLLAGESWLARRAGYHPGREARR